MSHRALITGITGQGAFLAGLLLNKGYLVHGIRRRTPVSNNLRIDHFSGDKGERRPRLALHFGDLTDASSLIALLAEVRPEEVYNLAAQSDVHVSFMMGEYAININGLDADLREPTRSTAGLK